MKNQIERYVISYALVTAVTIVAVHAVAMLLRKMFAAEVAPSAYPLIWATLISLAVSLLANLKLNSTKPRVLGALTFSLVVAAAFTMGNSDLLWPMMALPLVCPPAVLLASTMVQKLSGKVDGVSRRYPIRSAVWVLLTLLMIVQTARLSAWVTDPAEDWWISTDHPFFVQHLCMNAYIYAADLNRQGEPNVYDQSHYPGLNPEAEIHTTIKGLAPEDPFQYPPQFLLLPRLAIALTDDFDLIRIIWFFLQTLFFGFIVWTVARFIGGEVGLLAALMIPILWISFPVLFNMQYGQFHFMSVLLGISAMMWFSQGKFYLGGASLAFAMLSKVAPGVLLIYLIAQRRWKEVGWTFGFCSVFTLLAVMIVGTQPFMAFFSYQLPHIQAGTAFAFADVWPDFRDVIVAGNQSPFGFVQKLDALGVPGMTAGLSKLTHLIYTLAVVVIAFLAARIKASRHQQVLIWLALANLAALISKGAWGDYIPVGTLWMMTFMVGEMASTTKQKVVMAIMWLFMFTSLGTIPIFGLENVATYTSLAGIGMLLLIGFNAWVIFGRRELARLPIEE